MQDDIRVISVQEGELETETVLGVWKKAITLAKNEAYSKEVAFHTRKGCKANIQTRDTETGWCYKNGGQPLFGYKSVQLLRGEERKGRPIIKSIWVLDETIVNGKPIYEWARECLTMAANGVSLASIRDYCNRNGIPGRRSPYWVTNTWYCLLQPAVVMKYCGVEVYNVHDKSGRERPTDEWVVVENAHPALISEEQAQAIIRVRRESGAKRFDKQSHLSGKSTYLLTGGLFTCGRCGCNMVAYVNGDGSRYRCASHNRGKDFKCGRGVMAKQAELELEVIEGLKEWLEECTNPRGFTQLVNDEYLKLWQEAAGIDPQAERKRTEIDRKIENLRRAMEQEVDAEELNWTRRRIQELKTERETLAVQLVAVGQPPKIDSKQALSHRSRLEHLLEHGTPDERKALLRECIEAVIMHPTELMVEVRYQFPGIPLPQTKNLGTVDSTEVHCKTCGSGGARG